MFKIKYNRNKQKTLFKREAEFKLEPIKIVKNEDIKYLKKKAALSKRNRYRFCLHESTKHLTQEMIICFRGFQYIPPHRHKKNTSESYYMMEGKMDVYLFNNNGSLIDIVHMEANRKNPKAIFFYKISKPIFHTVLPRSKIVVYHEALTGPFTCEYAKFGPKNGCPQKEALNFFDSYK